MLDPRSVRCLVAVRTVVALLLVAFALPATAGAPEEISIGRIHKLKSDILEEGRAVLVHVPAGYDLVGDRYPVLYLLDGEQHFDHVAGLVRFLGDRGNIPRTIVVGVVNTDRTRDFTPTHRDKAEWGPTPSSGGADKFLRFMEKELIPWVEKNYRTQPYRVLAGHCLCGLFVTHVLLTRPDLFQAHIAISPYLAWDDKEVMKRVPKGLRPIKKGFYHLSLASEGESQYAIDADVASLAGVLKTSAPRGLDWKSAAFPGEDHDSVVPAAIRDGLRALYPDWRSDPEASLADLQAHHRKLGTRYGYEIPIPEQTLNLMGYRLLFRGKVKESIEVLAYNVKLYPDSANVYDSLGEALEKDQQDGPALKNYEKAVRLLAKKPGHDERVMKVYREHVARAKEKIAKKE